MAASPTGRTPQRILYLLPNAKKGGAEQLTWLLAKHHDRRHWAPQALFLANGPLVERFRELDVPVTVPPSLLRHAPRLRDPASVARAVKTIAEVIRAEKIDLVHSAMGYGHIFGGLAAAWARVPEVWFQHGPVGRLDWLTGRVPTRMVLVNSQHTLSEQKRYRAGPAVCVYPGIEAPPSIRGVVPQFPDPSKRVTFGLIARVSPMKGHALLIDAAGKLSEGLRARTRFLVVGAPFMPSDDAYLKEVRAMIERRGLSGTFEFTGAVSDPWGALASCDAVVNASVVPEPFGLSIVEAMSAGLPVIAPDQGGPREIIEDGVDGFLFRAGDAGSLASRLEELAESAPLRAQLGEKAQATARSRFSAERMTREIESCYEQVLFRD